MIKIHTFDLRNQENDFAFLHVCDMNYDVQNMVIDLEQYRFSVLI